ncbi:MAG: RelA/SpoT domain-containing protein [Bacteroidales bacterium]|nr:RelA/SpoT domain-containing protein [Clostridium sp.]MCM1204769.1 RelA/SpoT domain-containing protein [Bacteroidales bacterium]
MMEYKDNFDEQLDKLYNTVINSPEREIEKIICKKLDKCGMMYRIFSRTKKRESAKDKIEKKRKFYLNDGKKMQDLVGVRIVLYFKDDIDICIDILKQIFDVDNYEYDKPNAETFKPQRINYVFKMPESIMKISDDISNSCLIDNTFEVQIRTIFSEGWHEVEHDIRYKYLDEWNTVPDFSRELNGILAVLEICDRNIMSICEQLAYRKYKEREWDSMIRNKFRLRFAYQPLDSNLSEILSSNLKLAKELFRFDREKLIYYLAENPMPRNCNNVVYVINEMQLHNEQIRLLTPSIIVEKCKRVK